MKKVLTLLIVQQDGKVLLGMKKYGFGMGRWNGFGGKVEKGESIEAAARREAREEAGIEVTDLEKAGVIDFEFQGNPEILEVHLFRATDFAGEPTESEEMRPQWFAIDDIPYQAMWADDQYWLPKVLGGQKIKAYALFDSSDQILECRVEEMREL